MKTIEDRAHDYFLETIRFIRENNIAHDFDEIVKESFDYAEAMQAEAEKRKVKEDARSLTKDEHGNCLHFHHEFGRKNCMDCGACLEEWQPDWSQAPKWVNWWCQDEDGGSWWCEEKPIISTSFWNSFDGKAPSFNYQGDWKDSLRKRP